MLSLPSISRIPGDDELMSGILLAEVISLPINPINPITLYPPSDQTTTERLPQLPKS